MQEMSDITNAPSYNFSPRAPLWHTFLSMLHHTMPTSLGATERPSGLNHNVVLGVIYCTFQVAITLFTYTANTLPPTQVMNSKEHLTNGNYSRASGSIQSTDAALRDRGSRCRESHPNSLT